MTTERDTERLLRQWFDEGPTRAADRLVETVEERIERQRQRPVWRLNWRTLFMNRTIGSFAAGMAVVAVALIGFNLYSNRGADGTGVGGPEDPSSPVVVTPSPDASASPTDQPGAGGLSVSFTSVPDGWAPGETQVIKGEEAAVEVFEDRSVMSAYPECVYGPAPGIGRSAAEIVDALSTREGLDVAGPEAVEIGGLGGQVLDLAVAEGWTNVCPWWEDPETPMVPTLGGFDDKNNWLFNGVVGDERYRLWVLDAPDGGNVVIAAWAANADLWSANEADITSIIGGIGFETGS